MPLAILSALEFHQLYAARRALELGALREGGRVSEPGSWIEQVSDEDIEEVLELERAVRASAHGPRYAEYADSSRADAHLHRKFVALAGNPFFEQSWTSLHCHLHLSRLYAGTGVIDFDEAREEHASLVTALIDREVEGIVRAAAVHLDRAEARLASLIR